VNPETGALADQIDVREFIVSLLRHWRLLAGLTLLGILVAVGACLLMPPVYEAVAVVSVEGDFFVAKPQNLWMSDELLAELADELGGASVRTEALSVEADANDPNLIRLTARGATWGEAAALANTWAAVSSRYSMDWLLSPRETDLESWREELGQAEAEVASVITQYHLEAFPLSQIAAYAGAESAYTPLLQGAVEHLVLPSAQRLELNRSLAQWRYAAGQVARAEEELRVMQGRIHRGEVIRIVNLAGLPETPIRPRWGLYVGLAGFSGLMGGILLALMAEWFRPPRTAPRSS